MKTLVVQRGHAGRTRGSTGTAGEQAMAIAVSKRVAARCPSGWQVKLIDADESDSAYKGDAFVAIHGDGNNDPRVGGASVGYRAGGKLFAEAWKKAYPWPYTWKRDNYTENLAGYYGCRIATAQGNTKAIVIEVGMMTNPTERRWIDSHHKDIAASVWTALGVKKEEDMPNDNICTVTVPPEKYAAFKNYLVNNNLYGDGIKYVNGRPVTFPINPPYFRVEPGRDFDVKS